jgi:hypothetical protein
LGNRAKEIIKTSAHLREIIQKNLPIDQDISAFEIICEDTIIWEISEPLFEIALKNII